MRSLLFIMASSFLLGCGDEEISKNDISGRVANAALMMEWAGQQEYEGLGFTLKKMRVWKSRANNESGGQYDSIDLFAVELWYQLEKDKELAQKNMPPEEEASLLEGEEEEFKYTRYKKLDKLRATDDGYLYPESIEPGTTIEEIPNGLSRLTEDGLFSYTRNETDGMVNTKYPSHLIYNEVTGKSGETITKKQIIKAHEVSDSGWENTFNFQLSGNIDSRKRYEMNKDMATKGKLGCLVKPVTAANVYEERTFLFADIELGDTLRDSKSADTSVSVEDENTLGDDDELWIEWYEDWYLTGLNWQTRSTRMLRKRSAPYYLSRELPGVDKGDAEGKPSGVNALVKSCNDAAKSGNGSWQFIGLTSGTSSRIQTFGSSNSYCESLKDTADIGKEALNNTDFGCAGLNTGVLLPGTFDGSTHSGPLTSVGASFDYQEMSAVVEVILP